MSLVMPRYLKIGGSVKLQAQAQFLFRKRKKKREKLEMRGIDPRTSRMLSERSTI